MSEVDLTALELFCKINDIEVPDTIEDDIISIEVEGIADIWILDVEDDGVEVFAPIPGVDTTNPIVLRALLEANYLGMATDAARIGLDPFSGDVALCARWTTEELLRPDARTRLAAFAGLASGWRTDGVRTLIEHAKGSGSETTLSEEHFIKI